MKRLLNIGPLRHLDRRKSGRRARAEARPTLRLGRLLDEQHREDRKARQEPGGAFAYRTQAVSLAAALDRVETNLAGRYLYVVKVSGAAQVHIGGVQADGIDARRGFRFGPHVFDQVAVSCDAQTGAELTLVASAVPLMFPDVLGAAPAEDQGQVTGVAAVGSAAVEAHECRWCLISNNEASGGNDMRVALNGNASATASTLLTPGQRIEYPVPNTNIINHIRDTAAAADVDWSVDWVL